MEKSGSARIAGARGSAVDLRHLALAVARARDRWKRRIELCELGSGEHHIRCAHVLLQILAALGSWDRNDVLAPAQQPRQCDLTRGRPFPLGDFLDDPGDPHVFVEVLALQARVIPAEVAFRERLGALDGAGEEAAAERSERHEADAELAQERDDARLEVPLPERVLALQRRDWVHRMGASNGLFAGLRQAEVANLASSNQISHRADHLLDRDLLVDAVLVEEVDAVGAEPSQRGIHDFADVLWAAVEAGDLSLFDAEAELGGDDA